MSVIVVCWCTLCACFYPKKMIQKKFHCRVNFGQRGLKLPPNLTEGVKKFTHMSRPWVALTRHLVIPVEPFKLSNFLFMCGFSIVAALKGCFREFLTSNGITCLEAFGVFKIDQLYVEAGAKCRSNLMRCLTCAVTRAWCQVKRGPIQQSCCNSHKWHRCGTTAHTVTKSNITL